MVHVGLAGFNCIERCGISRWGRDKFPNINFQMLKNAQESEQVEGVVLDTPTYQSWCLSLPLDIHILVLTDRVNFQALNLNVKVLSVCEDWTTLEKKFHNWLLPLVVPVSFGSKRLRSAFSAREKQIMALLHGGASNEQIGQALEIQVSTVKTYLRRIYERIGASNRTHAVALYHDAHLQ